MNASVAIVIPVSHTRSPTSTTKAPSTKSVIAYVTTVKATKKDVTGSITGRFVEWSVPTTGSYMDEVAAPGGGEVWFTENTYKIGRLS